MLLYADNAAFHAGLHFLTKLVLVYNFSVHKGNCIRSLIFHETALHGILLVRAACSGSALFANGNMIYLILTLVVLKSNFFVPT